MDRPATSKRSGSSSEERELRLPGLSFFEEQRWPQPKGQRLERCGLRIDTGHEGKPELAAVTGWGWLTVTLISL